MLILLDNYALLMKKGFACLARMVASQRIDIVENLNEIVTRNRHKKSQPSFSNKKETYFTKFINLINIPPTWPHAINLLHVVYSKKGIDPPSQEALRLQRLIYLHYFPVSKSNNKNKLYHVR